MATHLKSLAKRARSNEGHVKAARVYEARVTALVSERAELRNQLQSMTEEVVKLKYDLKHTTLARARAESREEKARTSLKVAEVELQEVKDGLQAAQDDLLEARDGLQAARTDLQAVRDELQSSRNELRGTKEEMRSARDELRNKAALLDGACCEAF